MTTQQGSRLATSVGGTLTGKGGDFLIIDDPLKPEEALSDALRNGANNWYDSTAFSRQAAWLDAFVLELTIFPRGKYDDQVDSTAQELAWMAVNPIEPALLQYYRKMVQQEQLRRF